MSTGVPDPVCRAVLRRLDQVDLAAGSIDPQALLPVARRELNRFANGWRTLLTRHQADQDGRCITCHGLLRGRRWPCQVWRAAHEALIGDQVADTGTAPPRNRRLRPVR